MNEKFENFMVNLQSNQAGCPKVTSKNAFGRPIRDFQKMLSNLIVSEHTYIDLLKEKTALNPKCMNLHY